MAQNRRALLGTDVFGDSWTYLNNSDEAIVTQFAGPTEPPSPSAYQPWADTTTGLLKYRNAANDAWIVSGVLGSEYQGLLARGGGTMTGPIDMGGQVLTNLGLSTGTGAARSQEVALKASLDSPAFVTDATLNVDPPGVNSLVRRSWAEGRYLKTSGGTMTGPIVLSGSATAALHPYTKQQMDDFASISVGHYHDGSDSRRVLGTSINSAAATSQQSLIANGSGGASWGSPVTVGTTQVYLTMADPGVIHEVAVSGLGVNLFLPQLHSDQAYATAYFHALGNTGTSPGVSTIGVATSHAGTTAYVHLCWLTT
jgi:hypothetical protein